MFGLGNGGSRLEAAELESIKEAVADRYPTERAVVALDDLQDHDLRAAMRGLRRPWRLTASQVGPEPAGSFASVGKRRRDRLGRDRAFDRLQDELHLAPSRIRGDREAVGVAWVARGCHFLDERHETLLDLGRCEVSYGRDPQVALGVGAHCGRAQQVDVGGARAGEDRLVEAARAEIDANKKLGWPARLLRWFVYKHLLRSPFLLTVTGYKAYLYQRSGLQRLVRRLGILKPFGRLSQLERLAPAAEPPFFFRQIGKVFPAHGERRHRVAMMAGCIANVSFARLNEATVRVLQRNGCEVTVAADQACCGALHVHAGLRDLGREQAKRNITALERGEFDAIITNSAGCGSVMKEYPDLFERDSPWYERAVAFSSKLKDVSEFLATIELNRDLGPLPITVTYQDSCHLLHGQKVRTPPRQMLDAIPELRFQELPLTELCCGSAGVYNIEQTEMSMSLLEQKMQMIETTGADTIATANPGCLLQLRAGAEMFGRGQRVVHVVELLDEAYRQGPS